jgi:type III pantothenate kinase
MSEKLLLVDIGNTCIKLVFASPDALEASYSLPTRTQHTPDSLGLALMQLLSLEGLKPEDLTACAVCSVVPDVNSLFRDACLKYLGKAPLSFPGDFTIDMVNGYDQPQEVGADRLLAAYAARRLFPEPASIISVDFGTATTFDCVSGNTYLGGLICPGLFSSRNALAANTAKLPRISLDVTETSAIIGRNTATSMNHGFLFGFSAMTEGLCERLKAQLPAPVFVVGTGGIAQDLSGIYHAFDAIRSDLIPEGLRLVWNERRVQA